ncbi:MAG: hypothetical protein ABIU85_00635 [Methylotenera sp.]
MKAAKQNARQPSPDNSGLLIEKPKPLDEAAAEVNRDVGVLMREFPNKNVRGVNRKKPS